ncbi:MAG: DNA/RNA nuclease SfsA [Chloroflexota bacterium]
MERSKQSGFKILDLPPPVECRIVSRLNRFVVQVEVAGRYYRAHTNNTGRLHHFLVTGQTGFCLKPDKPGRTDYKLFAIAEDNLGAIIDTQLQMTAFEAAVKMGLVPWLKEAIILRRNARLGGSFIDYLLVHNKNEVFLEVKSAVLRNNHYAMYPDCPTARGRKHISELTEYVRGGGKAILLFIAALPGVLAFTPDRSADRELYNLLVKAHHAGVMMKAINMVYRPEDTAIYLVDPNLPVEL